MGSLEKFSEAIDVVELKKEAMEDTMKQMMLEWADVEQNSRIIVDLSAQALSEVGSRDSRQKYSNESRNHSLYLLETLFCTPNMQALMDQTTLH